MGQILIVLVFSLALNTNLTVEGYYKKLTLTHKTRTDETVYDYCFMYF